ncbi:hypothetical protein A2467_01550 [Candidatus Nomurabacteria bacterium RIFOXYC2_FULL_36_8]|nr:MAG: hypothetical protein US17_C0001G0119 [Candidatus Nomurabacteria bacterium GW2011_GWF1_36_47]OGJ06475.1 MAG: hypothetical protein A2387_01825 [Candidatus Nomurabacteria bacterium RIFOXYB1_FULL_36_10]OGJ11387.1 MAG: hypothetical protein A2565_00495 [Candidatus Nomurabacteria bacterium RIFOXYD1_FULL_36_19]OGJ12067.1 MAG: hypothetical protein A2467_01550 [Candidatus Nomurabacteria bacterium RIFOXYC2_FULL_36_8]HAQ02689.1 hypothetical protein [Candidatus Nomurabacteria bacterium]
MALNIMDYNHIKNYLEKFKNLLFTKEEIYQIVSRAIEDNIHLKIETKNIQIKPPFLYIKASPLVRNEIMINKEKILKDILLLSPQSNLKDIR